MKRCVTLLLGATALVLLAQSGIAAPPDADGKSGDGDRAVKITFRNKTDKSVSVFWVNFEGAEESYGTIAAGSSSEQNTCSTHLWRFKIGKETIASYRAGEKATQQFDVTRTKPAPAADPAKPTPVAGTGSSFTAKEAEELVEYHNKVRKDVGVGAVKWSSAVAKFAQEWADECARTGKVGHRSYDDGPWKQKYGENLAYGFGGGYTVMSGAKDWYGEIQFYAPGTPIPQNFGSFKAGHYTQMVWKDTTEIGAGKAIILTGDMKDWLIHVCNYKPPGNTIGQKPY